MTFKIGRNRKELIDKIIANAQDIGFYHDDDMSSQQGKFEDQEKGKNVMKNELNQYDFAYLHCNEQGNCGVHVTMNDFYNFKIDPQIIGQEIKREEEKRGKRQQKSQEHQSKLRELGISALPKGMSFEQAKEQLEQQKKKREEFREKMRQMQQEKKPESVLKPIIVELKPSMSIQPKSDKITMQIEGTCDELYAFSERNVIWDNPLQPDLDTFGNKLARKFTKTILDKCPDKSYTKDMLQRGVKKHIKPSD